MLSAVKLNVGLVLKLTCTVHLNDSVKANNRDEYDNYRTRLS